MANIWRPEIEDFIEAHDQAGNISKIRTPGFMHSREAGIEKLEEIISEAKELEEPYKLAAFYLRETVKKQPFSDGNHRTGIVIAKETLNENDEEFKVSKIRTGDEIKDDMKWNLKTSTVQEIAEWIKTGEF
jgi:prophage maintenance system killer protein